jgi:DNA adenine methylase
MRIVGFILDIWLGLLVRISPPMSKLEPCIDNDARHHPGLLPWGEGERAKIYSRAQPFLKWAGGKAQLLNQFEACFPSALDSYIEPFLGGGAVFFHLKARFPKMRAALRDTNGELINCYKRVRDNLGDLMRHLDEHLESFRKDPKHYYYLVRSQHDLKEEVARAARMIFLNKTCFNGLWRVNAKGEFNVPIGSYRPEKVALYNAANLLAASSALRDADLAIQDFRQTLSESAPGDFLYVDPPYVPLSTTASFTSYTKENFGEREQRELATLFAEAARRGVQLLLSNSDTPLIREIYKGFQIRNVQARRAVNSNGTKRGLIPEVVVLSHGI